MKNNSMNKTEEFIQKANAKHNYRYDYSLVQYDKNIIPIKIICPIHGEFKQSPKNHLSGCGCPKCGAFKRDYIPQFMKIYKDTYDYSTLTLIDDKTFSLVCKKHGKFITNIQEHLSGCGCPYCQKEIEKSIPNYKPQEISLPYMFNYILIPYNKLDCKKNLYTYYVLEFIKDVISEKYKLNNNLYHTLTFGLININKILLNPTELKQVQNLPPIDINYHLVKMMTSSLGITTNEFYQFRDELRNEFDKYIKNKQ